MMLKSITSKFVFSMVLVAATLSNSAMAEVRKEQKIFQFGGPETRTRCVQEAKTKGIPSCTVKDWEIRCEDTWVSACTGWATDFMQHEYFLVVTGPDAPDALKNILDAALTRSLGMAVAAAISTPGEAATKAAAAFAAFKITFYSELAVEPILAAAKDQYQLSIRTTSDW